MKHNRGRPPKYVIDSNGRPVVGLSYDKENNVYFNTHWKTDGIKKENFGGNKDEAIARFRIWESNRQGKLTTISEVDPEDVIVESIARKKLSPEAVKFLNSLRRKAGEKELESDILEFGVDGDLDYFKKYGIEVKQQYTFLEGLFWQNARKLILEDIHKARKHLNLPIILDGKVFSEKSISLEEICDIYFSKRRKQVCDAYKKKGILYWSEFRKVVKVKMVSQLTDKHFEDYENWIYKTAKINHWSNSTINNRLKLVATVFNQVGRERLNALDKEHIRNAHKMCNFNYTDSPDFDPNPITKEDYLKILNKTSDKIYRAVMLTSLNCGMKETELADVRIKYRTGRKMLDIDLKNKTLSKPRMKTGIISVAILWDRTVEAIREMLDVTKNKTEYLFVNNAGNPIKARNIHKWWRRERRRAGVSEEVKFENIRDASQTVPIDYDPKFIYETKLLMGHSIPGVTNNYLERRPNMVKRVCEVIENHFFS